MSSMVKNIIGTGASLAWQTSKIAARGTQLAAQGIYNATTLGWDLLPTVGGIKQTVQKTWAASDSTTMRVAGAFGAAVVGGGAAVVAASAAAPLIALGTAAGIAVPAAVATFAPSVIGLGAGIGTVGTLLKSNPQTALKVAGATVAGGAAFLTAPVAAGMAALGTGAAVLMAENPDRLLLVTRPEGSPLEFTTVRSERTPLIPLETTLRKLAIKSEIFREKHPPGMFVSFEENSNGVDPNIEQTRQKQEILTNAMKDRFIANIAASTSVDFIFVKRLGLPMQSATGVNIVMQIAEKVSTRQPDGKYPNLWSTCMSCLKANGIHLSKIQWIRAKFWYFLSDMIGIVPNTFKEIGESLLKYFRGGVQQQQLPTDIARIIAIADSFLEKYKSAVKRYADAGQPGYPPNIGNLADYQRTMIDELGEIGLVETAKSHRKTGQDLGKVVIQDLCTEFVKTIVNDPEIFPPIPFFKNLQGLSFMGFRIGAVFDIFAWAFGGILNWIGKKIIKAYAPNVLQNVVQKGLNQAMPGNFAFKMAVAKALKGQVDELNKQFNLNIPSHPLRFGENRQLNDVISKLIETLELTACKGNAGTLRHKFRELEERANPALANNEQLEKARKNSELLNKAVIEGAQFLIEHYTKNPEALEELFEKLFELSNDAFHFEAQAATEEQYRLATDSLQTAVRSLMDKLVEKTAREKVYGEQQETMRDIFVGISREIPEHDDPDNPNRRIPARVIRHPGLFTEHIEKAKKTSQLLTGLALKMSKNLQADRDAPVPPPPEQIALKIRDAETQLQSANATLQQKQTDINHAGNRATALQRSSLKTAQQQKRKAELLLLLAKGQTNYDNGRKKVQEMQVQLDRASTSNAPEAQFHLTQTTHECEQKRLELEIAKEHCKAAAEVVRLETLIDAINGEIVRAEDNQPALMEARKKLQDAETKLTYARAEEAPGLIEARIQFNRLTSASSPDHLLKDLDNYRKVIDRFIEQTNALNIDLYNETVSKTFNHLFGHIHQKILHLTEQLIPLQAVEKTYDQSKRLSELFASVESNITQTIQRNAPPRQTLVESFRTKLAEIEKVDSLRKYEENREKNVTRFASLIQELEPISKAYAAKESILKQLQTLGHPDQLGHAILTYRKKWVQELRAKIPQEDRAALFSLISQLQEKASLTPRPDLLADQGAIASKLSEIIQKYQNQKQEQLNLGIDKHRKIQEWVRERLRETGNRRDQARVELTEKFRTLKDDTKTLANTIEQTTFRPSIITNNRVAPYIPFLPGRLNRVIDENVRMITELTNAAYEFITSEEIPEAITRLTLGEVIRSHKR